MAGGAFGAAPRDSSPPRVARFCPPPRPPGLAGTKRQNRYNPPTFVDKSHPTLWQMGITPDLGVTFLHPQDCAIDTWTPPAHRGADGSMRLTGRHPVPNRHPLPRRRPTMLAHRRISLLLAIAVRALIRRARGSLFGPTKILAWPRLLSQQLRRFRKYPHWETYKRHLSTLTRLGQRSCPTRRRLLLAARHLARVPQHRRCQRAQPWPRLLKTVC